MMNENEVQAVTGMGAGWLGAGMPQQDGSVATFPHFPAPVGFR